MIQVGIANIVSNIKLVIMSAEKPRAVEALLSSPVEQTSTSPSLEGMRNLFTVLAIGIGTHLAGWYLELNQHLQTGLLVIISCMVVATVTNCGTGRTETIIINIILGLLTQYACYYFQLGRTIRLLNALNTCFTIYLAVNNSSENAEKPEDKRHVSGGREPTQINHGPTTRGLDGTSIVRIIIVTIFAITVTVNFFAGYF